MRGTTHILKRVSKDLKSSRKDLRRAEEILNKAKKGVNLMESMVPYIFEKYAQGCKYRERPQFKVNHMDGYRSCKSTGNVCSLNHCQLFSEI